MNTILDLRAQLPLIADQGTRRCCLAMAASNSHAQRRKSNELSAEYLYYHAVMRTPGADPDGGAGMQALADAMFIDGQPDEAGWPFETLQMTPPAWAPPGEPGEIFRAKVHVQPLGVTGIADRLGEGRTVVLGLIVTDAFYAADKSGLLPALMPDREHTGHAVLAVGLGEDLEGERHILVRNSWGQGWGDAGHAWLSEAYLDKQLCETAIVEPD